MHRPVLKEKKDFEEKMKNYKFTKAESKLINTIKESVAETLEMGNVPDDCLKSAIASLAAYKRRARAWVIIDIDLAGKTPDKYTGVDLRQGREYESDI